MKIIRLILGEILLFFDRTFSPRTISRAPEKQAIVNAETKSLSLYQFAACPFCVKVRRAIRRLNLNIEIIDILKNQQYEKELIEKGGQRQVPCLKIEGENRSAEWMYESSNIVTYLEKRFGTK